MKSELHYECSSCPSKMADVRAHIRASAKAAGFSDEWIEKLVLAVDEACTNIIRHAYNHREDGKIEIDPMITSTLPLERINEGFETMHRGEGVRTVVLF